MTLSKSRISSLLIQLNSDVTEDAKRAVAELDVLLYPNYGPGPRVFSAEESRRISDNHYGAIHGSEAIEPILATTRHGTDFARAYAVTVLGVIRDRRALPVLVEALGDAAPEVRMAATKGLWFFHDSSTISALVRVLEEDAVGEVRCSAAQALGFIRSVEAVPALMAFYEHGNSEAKVSVLHALGYIGDSRSLPLVRGALFDRIHVIRKAAKSALAQYDFKRRELLSPAGSKPV